MSDIVLSCENIKKTYQGPSPVHVLQGVDLEVRKGESVAIMGRSGSGKSTLLHLLGGLDTASEGSVSLLGRGIAWLDTGTHRSLVEASNFVEVLEERTGVKIACLEEIAWRNGWIGDAAVLTAAESMGKSTYAEYLRSLLD